ncbi:G-protein coupled receptors family 1 profile domain-containing protein [Caenorhabditis elegans]|uniref:G-protein coupled receptors family 1 profile domain-containing protein n=1 Tax=Caenorhabditis elegans TaxID=6239 RepID=Q9XU32_CAEEL|nr:G-protein coupled receptors family 1 profile domain-containing protein [Caenorhabditis elegans]CAB07190.1 G-protein coupled receptors family 1 profile domain-containing protein [Caenorhabditis elegans]|eukprot:NP_507223.1 Serpentine Receptor, class W [Caenorhabditis elegans]
MPNSKSTENKDSHSIFDIFDLESEDFWYSIWILVREVKWYIDLASLVIAFVGFFGNIFHLAVLTRKSMRILSVSTFLISIAICDFVRMMSTIVTLSPIFYREYLSLHVRLKCQPPPSYLEMYIIYVFHSLETVSMNLSVWFAVFMTIFRALAIRYPLNKRIKSLITSESGLCTVITITILILPFCCLSFFLRTLFPASTWYPSPGCKKFSKGYTQIQYRLLATELSGELGTETSEIMQKVEGLLFKFLPSVVLSLATFALVFAIRKHKKKNCTPGNKSDKEKTTKLVSFVTFTFLIAIVPQGILFMIMFKVFETSMMGAVIDELSTALSFLSVINGTIHLLIIYFMCSEYRKTIRCMFCRKSKPSISAITLTETGNMTHNTKNTI